MTAADPRVGEIQARLDAATPGPWKADTGTRGDCVVWGPNGRFLMNMQAEPHWLEYPGETRSVAFDVDKRDAEFIAGSREDIAYLLAELRARDEVIARVGGVIDRLDDEHKNALAGESNCAEANYGAGLMAYQAQTYAYKQAATLLRAAVAAAGGGGE